MIANGNADDVATLDDLTDRIDQVESTIEAGMPVILSGNVDALSGLASSLWPRFWPTVDAAISDLEALADAQQSKVAAETASASQAADTTLWLLIGLSTTAFLVAAGTLAMLAVSVLRPLFALRASARAITSGNLEARAKVAGPEEVASLAHDFNEMTDALAAKTKELEVRAITDGLTGLHNHAHFYQRLTEEIERSKRYKRGFAVVMLDVDAFKHYNDSRGHQAGDMVLQLVADCIRAGVRGSDFAFRYGGDEFATILLDADSPTAQGVVKRMNRDISRRLTEMSDSAAGWLRLSAGVACFPEDATTADELVRIADAALYDTKGVARTPA
jgi:diguanylate cyclase (GGDEF)-like protein